MKLYSYFRSSAAFRVRIALALKNLDFEVIPVHLVKDGGEQKMPAYAELNPQKLVPALQINDETVITQSLAIMEYLESTYPSPALLPGDAINQAKIREFCQAIACDIHPLNNLRVLQYLTNNFEVTEEQKQSWYQHWIITGFNSIEVLIDAEGQYCFGDTPTLADCCLIPQVYNAKRFKIDLTQYTNISRVFNHCMQLPAFIDASPESQLDAPK